MVPKQKNKINTYKHIRQQSNNNQKKISEVPCNSAGATDSIELNQEQHQNLKLIIKSHLNQVQFSLHRESWSPIFIRILLIIFCNLANWKSVCYTNMNRFLRSYNSSNLHINNIFDRIGGIGRISFLNFFRVHRSSKSLSGHLCRRISSGIFIASDVCSIV